jgi:ribonuclease D
MMDKNIKYYIDDLPKDFSLSGDFAIDTEAMGLRIGRDRLCLVQLYFAEDSDSVYLVHFVHKDIKAPNLIKILADGSRTKVFHYARFDLSLLQHTFGIDISNVYCTKVASRIARTYVRFHGLKDLCSELLDVKISKQHQTSDWGNRSISNEQMEYAANDVIYLLRIREMLNEMLNREGRSNIAQRCFEFLPIRAKMDVEGWPESILAYKCEFNE